MSDTEMTLTPSSIIPIKGRMDKVPEYHGKRDQLEAWLLHCDLHFHVNNDIDDVEKGTLAATRLRGDAFELLRPRLQRFLDETITDEANDLIFEEWPEFKRHLRQVFGQHKQTMVAERKIQSLKQTSSVADYTNLFRQYAAHIEWNDDALRRMFRQGLKPQVLEELMRSSAAVDTLDQLIDEAIRLDNELYQLQQETQGYRRKEHHHPNKGKRRQDYVRTTNSYRTAGHYTSQGPEQMHLDSVTREHKPWKVENKGKGKKKVVCYGCGKEGHFARNCQSKNKVTRHVAVIGHSANWSDTDTGPWEVVAPMEEEGYDEWDPTWAPATDLCMEASMMGLHDTESNKENVAPPEVHPGTRVHGPWDGNGLQFIQEEPQLELRRETMGVTSRPRRRHACNACYNRRIRCAPSHQEGTCRPCLQHDRVCIGFSPRTLQNPSFQRITNTTPEDQKRVTARLQWEELRKQEQEGLTIAKCIPPGEDYTAIRYDDDWRNPKHISLHYRACTYDYCDAHYHVKVETNHFPKPRSACRWQWFDCTKDICRYHLWDKRTTNYFPGHDATRIAQRGVVFMGSCQNPLWQTCMNPECTKHALLKEQNGFDEKSFLDRNRKLNLNITTPPRSDDDQEDSEPYATSE